MRTHISLAPRDASSEDPRPQAPLAVADLLVSYLQQLGIDYVFGIPGGAIEPLYSALARSSRRGGPRPVVARHEAGAAFMADGYTRETGKIGVCCATSGPGATNLITGVATAYDNCIPMLVITGQPALPSFGKGALQESACTGVNSLAMFQHCTRYNSLVSHPDQLEQKLVTALARALRAPRGPAHLSIPLDILKSPSPVPAPSHELRALLRTASLLDETAIDLLFEQVRTARNIVVLLGGSCGEAADAILAFAALKHARVVTTPDGKGHVDPRHPLLRGVFGFAGHADAEAAVRDEAVDLILAVGCSMGEWTSNGWNASLLNGRLIHIDDNEDHLARTPMARLHVRGRILRVFERLCERLRAAGETVRELREARQSDLPDLPELPGQDSDTAPIKPQRLMRELGLRFPRNTRFLADAGNSLAWAVHYLHPQAAPASGLHDVNEGGRSEGGWLRVTMEFAPMGWAIGGAVGTALGNPAVPVVCLTGDGSMLMSGQELSVAVAERLTVIYVVLNDAGFGMVKHGQRLGGAERIGYELPLTDFAGLARALGAQAWTIRSPQELDALDLDAICRRQGPTLLDVRIDGEEVPPMNLRMRVLGTAA